VCRWLGDERAINAPQFEGLVSHECSAADASVVAWRQAQLMRLVIYDGSVSGHTQGPLEWFPFGTPDTLSGFATPDPELGATGFVRGGSYRVDVTYPLQLTDGPQMPGPFP
jgi:hypothetical protein